MTGSGHLRGAVSLVGGVAALCLALCSCSTPARSATAPASSLPPAQGAYAAEATLSGPVTTGHVIEPESAYPLDLAADRYMEQEYFASGTAHAFTATAAPADGEWSITPASSAAYKTRILVRRPTNPARFNGTVVVEWLNVSGGESSPDWDYLTPELERAGYAYVGVSAQALAVNGGEPLLGVPAIADTSGLVHEEPTRYGTLHHPGDQYALDIYAQIGRAVRANTRGILGTGRARHVVAVGESQSAAYLTTFADTLQPPTHAFDGLFIHSRGGSAAALNGTAAAPVAGPKGVRIRTDTAVPVFMFETQTDLIELGYAAARQPDTNRVRTWEVAGTSHADTHIVGSYASVLGCTHPINDGPQHVVVQAAFVAFDRWVDRGTPPPSPSPFTLASTNPATLALDRHGNVVGGVRTPAVDVPVSTLSGAAPPGTSVLCSLFGSTSAFAPGELTALYETKNAYVRQYAASLDGAIARGYILRADRTGLIAAAQKASFPA